MDIETVNQIKAAVANGLARPAIEALFGRPFTEDEKREYRKAKAIYDINERKRIQERKYEHLSTADRVEKHRLKAAAIDQQLDEALSNVDWDRRNHAETSLSEWVKTYMCDGLALNDEPSERGYAVLRDMESALTSHANYMICMGRGFGKSSYCICATLYAIATGQQKYVMIIANNAHSSASLL